MHLEYLREIKGLFSYPRVGTEEKWAIVRYEHKYAFIWNMPYEEVMEDRSSGNSGLKWFDTRQEAESFFLDKLEQKSYYYPTEELF